MFVGVTAALVLEQLLIGKSRLDKSVIDTNHEESVEKHLVRASQPHITTPLVTVPVVTVPPPGWKHLVWARPITRCHTLSYHASPGQRQPHVRYGAALIYPIRGITLPLVTPLGV